ncbi:MAG TPA: alkaline phosphatase D family protein [Candidatus Binatia bacterium]|nr:alkaline phosphatase D family protein [Candidatus Binatia bacterium]
MLSAIGCRAAAPLPVSDDASAHAATSVPPVRVPEFESRAVDRDAILRRIFVGSCLDQAKPQPIWKAVFARQPDLAMLIGDNVYADAASVERLAAHYRRQLSHVNVRRFLENVPLLATWDDHDYGLDDAGAENPLREAVKEVFLQAFDPHASPERRSHEGVYDSVIVGPPEHTVQFILLDTRSFRSPLARNPRWLVPVGGRGPYVPTKAEDATILGAEQWDWLDEQLEKPARLRIIASSVQVTAQHHGWETWRNFPREYDRLMEKIEDDDDVPTVIVSGDRHLAEISRVRLPDGRPLYELTASSMNRALPINRPADNAHRLGPPIWTTNFGEIEIDWQEERPAVTLRIFDGAGALKVEERLDFQERDDEDGKRGDSDERGDEERAGQ